MADAPLQKIDTASLADKVRARIDATIAELIDEEQWTAMIKTEIDRFILGVPQMDYNDRVKKDAMGNVVRGEPAVRPLIVAALNDFFKKVVSETVNASQWVDAEQKRIGPLLEEIIKEQAPNLLLTILTGGLYEGIRRLTDQSTSHFSSLDSQMAQMRADQQRQQRGY